MPSLFYIDFMCEGCCYCIYVPFFRACLLSANTDALERKDDVGSKHEDRIMRRQAESLQAKPTVASNYMIGSKADVQRCLGQRYCSLKSVQKQGN